jgi:hypothetical protein
MHTRHSLGLLIVSSLCAGLPLSAGYPLQPGLAAAPGTNAVTPLSLVDTADLIAQPDVTFNWRRHEFFTVFAADHVIYARRFQATGSALGGRITLSPLNGWHLHPRVAYNVDIDRYLVVWEETEGPDDWVSIIWARLLDSTGAPLGARFRLSDTANFFGTANGVQPDVAARNFHHALEPNETAFVVTWREWFTGGFLRWITAERIDMNGVELESIVVGLPEDDTIPLPPDEQDNEEWREADVAYSPHFDRFLIVWNEDGVHARTLSAGGSPGPVVSLDAPTGRLVSMAYDMGSRKFLVGWCHDGQLYGDIVTAYVTPTNLGAFDMGSGCFPNLGAEPGGFLALHSGPDAAGDWGIARSYVSDTGSVWPSAMFGHDPDFSYSESTVATGQQGFSFGSWDAIDGSEPDRLVSTLFFGRYAHFVHGRSGNYGGSPSADLFVFRQSASSWRVRTSEKDHTVVVGRTGDIPVLMDLEGNGIADVGVWRPLDGTFNIRNTMTQGMVTVPLGKGGDIPTPADFSGDRVDDFAVFRQTDGRWWIRDGVMGGVRSFGWGEAGDVPTPADYDGDGDVDLAVWRPSTGEWRISSLDGTFTSTVVLDLGVHGAARPGDIPLQGNFVGSAIADQVIFRPSTGNWHRRDGETGAMSMVHWGTAGQMPMPLDYDGDGLLDLAVFSPPTGWWFIRDARGAWTTSVQFGAAGDLPAGAR